MTTARVPQLCSAIPSIDSFSMNLAHCLLRSLPLRSPLLSTRCRRRTIRSTPQLPARSFSTTGRSFSNSVEPLQQKAKASKQRSETLQGHETTASDTTSGEQSAPASITPSPGSNTSTTKPTPPRSSKPTHSDRDFLKTSRRITGTVIRTHTMAKTVAVSTNRQHFDRFLQKHYTKASKTLVHDPKETLVKGDVIQYGLFPPAMRAERIDKDKGKNVRYVLRSLVTPFGVPLNARVSGGNVKRKKGLDS